MARVATRPNPDNNAVGKDPPDVVIKPLDDGPIPFLPTDRWGLVYVSTSTFFVKSNRGRPSPLLRFFPLFVFWYTHRWERSSKLCLSRSTLVMDRFGAPQKCRCCSFFVPRRLPSTMGPPFTVSPIVKSFSSSLFLGEPL